MMSSSSQGALVREEQLRQELATLEAQSGEVHEAEAIVKRHIKLLHEYNEAKDAAQIIIGKLAVHKETTVKKLHEEYGLSADD